MNFFRIRARREFYLIIFFVLGFAFSKAQSDTTAIIKIIDEARGLFSENPRQSIKLSLSALSRADKSQNKKLIAKCYNTIGSAYYFLGIYDSSEASHRRALELQREINDVEGLGRSYTNIGTVYSDQGLNDKAINYFLIAEKKFTLCGYRLGQAKLNNSLGILFFNIQDYTSAIKYYREGLKIAKDLDDQSLYFSICINLANAYGDAGKLKDAIELYKLPYFDSKKNEKHLTLLIVCNNLCQSYLQLFNDKNVIVPHALDSARKFDREALSLLPYLEGNIQYKELAFTNHAIILSKDKRYSEAIPFLDTAIMIAKDYQDIQKLIALYNQQSLVLEANMNLSGALDALGRSSQLKDSLYTNNLEAKLSELNTVHNVEKKEAQINTLNTEKKNQKKVNILLIVIIGLVAISLIVTIYNYLQKKKDNLLISFQKKEVESKNRIIEDKQKEIIDSITYAKRLQEAILPTENYFKKHLPNSFVLYKPKDIVAGDFYWMETVLTAEQENLILFAAADCTGHGVPGAMVSVVCSNALNRSVLEFKLTDPGEILNKTRELVIATFAYKDGEEKKSGEVKDGMDISFCVLNKKTLELKWAGANNPLWLIHKDEFIEIKGDKQPIGKFENHKNFTTQTRQLAQGDCIYLITDGYADQFGGDSGKKFKYKPLKENLHKIHKRPMNEQGELLSTLFLSWRRDLEQVDDVCIIGVNI